MKVSINVHEIVNIKDNRRLQKMIKLKSLCDELSLSYLKKIAKNLGIDLDRIRGDEIKADIPHRKYEVNGGECIKIEMRDIPKEVKTIEIISSY